MALLQWDSFDDYLSPGVFAAKPGAVGKTKSLGRHASSVGAAGTTNHRETAKLFFVAGRARLRREKIGSARSTSLRTGSASPYRINRAYILEVDSRSARVSASRAIIRRTSRRDTLSLRCKAVLPASRKSASVRAPISAGRTVAARTRRFRITREYCIPAASPRSASSAHFL